MNIDNAGARHPDHLLDLHETGARLNASRSAIYRLFQSGQLRKVKLGGSTRVRASDVAALIVSLAQGGPAQ